MPTVQPPPKIIERVYVVQGLEGQDDQIDRLNGYFTEMQKTTVETAHADDFLSFAMCAHYFGIIMLETTAVPVAAEDISDDETEDEVVHVEEFSYADSREASRPYFTTGAAFGESSDSERLRRLRAAPTARSSDNLYTTLSEDEKVLLWREAFTAELEETADDPMVPMHDEPGTRPIYSSKGKFREHYPEGDEPQHHVHGNEPGEMETDFINWPDEGPSAAADTRTGHNWQDVFGPTIPIPLSEKDEPVGRELLEPEVYTSPAMEPVEVSHDPAMQAFVRESAIQFQHSLREARVKDYLTMQRRRRRNRNRRPATPVAPTTTRQSIGMIYLWASQNFLDPLHMGECSLGLYIAPEFRRKDSVLAVDFVVKQAFQDPECHRLQSIMVENQDKLYILDLLARAGFRNEGIRRRAFFSASACEWKDITYYAMLATEWVYDSNNDSGVRLRTESLWDEVFARHQKECDDLIRLEERSTLKRSLSIETIRERVASSLSVSAAASEAADGNETDTASSVRSRTSSKRRRTTYQVRSGSARSHASTSSSQMGRTSGELDWANSERDSEWEAASSGAESGPAFSVPRSATPSVAGSMSEGSSSQWDVL